MNVVPLTAILRERRRCRPRRGSDRLAPRSAQRNAADGRADLPQLVIKTDAFQQPSRIRVDRDAGSDLPYDLCLLEDAYIETSRPKRERSSQTSDSTADDCNAKRTGHFFRTFLSAARFAVFRGRPWPIRHKGAGYPGDPFAGARSDANRMLRTNLKARWDMRIRLPPPWMQ